MSSSRLAVSLLACLLFAAAVPVAHAHSTSMTYVAAVVVDDGPDDDHPHTEWMVFATDVTGEPHLQVCGTTDGTSCGSDGHERRVEGCGALSLAFPEPVPRSALEITMTVVFIDETTGAACFATTGTVTVSGQD